MSRGQIIEWQVNNPLQGVIAGCSSKVRGQFFGFSFDDVNDDGLKTILKNTQRFEQSPDCAEGPGNRWVFFSPNASSASNISRIFIP